MSERDAVADTTVADRPRVDRPADVSHRTDADQGTGPTETPVGAADSTGVGDVPDAGETAHRADSADGGQSPDSGETADRADSGESSAEASPRPVVHVPHQQAEAAADAVPRPAGDDSAQESASEQERAAESEHLPEGDRAAAQGRTPEQGRVPEQEREHAHACATEPEFVWDDGIIARRARVDRTAPAEHGGRRESEAEPWTPGPRSHSPGEEGPERAADRPATGSGFAPPWRSTVWPEDPYSGEGPGGVPSADPEGADGAAVQQPVEAEAAEKATVPEEQQDSVAVHDDVQHGDAQTAQESARNAVREATQHAARDTGGADAAQHAARGTGADAAREADQDAGRDADRDADRDDVWRDAERDIWRDVGTDAQRDARRDEGEHRLRQRLGALRELVGLSHTRLDPEVLAEAGRVLDEATARRGLPRAYTTVAVAGATGSGKSSLFNALTGARLSEVGMRRPTTAAPVACTWEAGRDSDGGPDGLLDRLGIPQHARHRTRDSALGGLVLIDLPDLDSVAPGHREQVDRLLELVDAVVWVVDPEKYADAVLHEDYLRRLAGHAEVTFVVLNQIDRLTRDGVDAVLHDLRRLLDEDGMALGEHGEPGAVVLSASALTYEGIDVLREELGEFVAQRRAAVLRLTADLDGAMERLRPVYADPGPGAVDGPAGLTETAREDFEDRLALAVGAAAAGQAAERAWLRQAERSAGTPWVRALRWYTSRPGSDRDEASGETATGAPVRRPRETLQQPRAARPMVAQAVRELADAAAAGLPGAWARTVRESARRGAAGLPEALDEVMAVCASGADAALTSPKAAADTGGTAAGRTTETGPAPAPASAPASGPEAGTGQGSGPVATGEPLSVPAPGSESKSGERSGARSVFRFLSRSKARSASAPASASTSASAPGSASAAASVLAPVPGLSSASGASAMAVPAQGPGPGAGPDGAAPGSRYPAGGTGGAEAAGGRTPSAVSADPYASPIVRGPAESGVSAASGASRAEEGQAAAPDAAGPGAGSGASGGTGPGGRVVRVPRPPWHAAVLLGQWLFLVLQGASAAWAVTVAVMAGGVTQAVALPVAALVAATLAGPVLAWGCRRAARGPARAYGLDAERRLRGLAACCGRTRVLEPVAAELLRYREVREQFAVAAGGPVLGTVSDPAVGTGVDTAFGAGSELGEGAVPGGKYGTVPGAEFAADFEAVPGRTSSAVAPGTAPGAHPAPDPNAPNPDVPNVPYVPNVDANPDVNAGVGANAGADAQAARGADAVTDVPAGAGRGADAGGRPVGAM
ncbi:hypothetical protein SUDANB19_02406 [Streptomyces sp. enrichment culture]